MNDLDKGVMAYKLIESEIFRVLRILYPDVDIYRAEMEICEYRGISIRVRPEKYWDSNGFEHYTIQPEWLFKTEEQLLEIKKGL